MWACSCLNHYLQVYGFIQIFFMEIDTAVGKGYAECRLRIDNAGAYLEAMFNALISYIIGNILFGWEFFTYFLTLDLILSCILYVYSYVVLHTSQ